MIISFEICLLLVSVVFCSGLSFRPNLEYGRWFNNRTLIPGRPSEVALQNGKKPGCQGGIQAYPSNWPNAYYYRKLCYSGMGMPIITGSLARDAAIERTAWTLDNMLAKVDPVVIKAMNKAFFRQAVMGRFPSEVITSLPEYRNQDPNFWYTRRGCGATDWSPVGANAEEDVLCYPDELYLNQDITVHEFAHSLHLLGFKHVWPAFQQELSVAYRYAYAHSLWGWGYIGSYAMTNSEEYFAEGLQAYFDVGYPYDRQGAPWNRAQLYRKDPTLAKFVDRYMGQNPWRGGCP